MESQAVDFCQFDDAVGKIRIDSWELFRTLFMCF